MNANTLVSQLQSRISIRSAAIRGAEEWAVVHKAQSQMRDWKDTKLVIRHLTSDQILDKKLLKVTQEMAYLEGMAEPSLFG